MNLLKILNDLLFPPECLACACSGAWLCQSCFAKLSINTEQSCLACGRPSRSGETCRRCRPFFYLDGVLAAGSYRDPLLVDLIHRFKFQGARVLAPILSRFLHQVTTSRHPWPLFLKIISGQAANINIWEKFCSLVPIVVPIPLAPRRQRWRGYNQAALLGQLIAPKLHLPYDEGLKKIKNTRAQAKLKAEERKSNLSQAFIWTGKPLHGEAILLIDDIATTGSTLNEAARTLKQQGAGPVWALVLARN